MISINIKIFQHNCRGDHSCTNGNNLAASNVLGKGAYSLMNSIIQPYTSTSTVYLYGYYSGHNGTLICKQATDTCSVQCYGNGCYGFNFVYNTNASCSYSCDESISINCPNYYDYDQFIADGGISSAIHSPNKSIENITNGIYLDIARIGVAINDACDSDSDSNAVTFDDHTGVDSSGNLTHNGSICCRGETSCRGYDSMVTTTDAHGDGDIVCTGYDSCGEIGNKIESKNGNIYCLASYSCSDGNDIISNHNEGIIYCAGGSLGMS